MPRGDGDGNNGAQFRGSIMITETPVGTTTKRDTAHPPSKVVALSPKQKAIIGYGKSGNALNVKSFFSCSIIATTRDTLRRIIMHYRPATIKFVRTGKVAIILISLGTCDSITLPSLFY